MWGPRPLTLRHFRSLARGIPLHDSSIGAALELRQVVDWGNVEELLAGLIEVLDYGNRLFISAHSKKGAAAPKPIKVHRPKRRGLEAEEERERRPATSEELRAFFGGAARYTGPSLEDTPDEGPARCDRGHYVKVGAPCRRCAEVSPTPITHPVA